MPQYMTWLSLAMVLVMVGCAEVDIPADEVEAEPLDSSYRAIVISHQGEVQEEVVVLDSDEALEQDLPEEALIQEEVVILESDDELEGRVTGEDSEDLQLDPYHEV